MSLYADAKAQERWAKEEEAKQRKMAWAWEKYKNLKPTESHRGAQERVLTFEDWVKETDDYRRVKTTTFRIAHDGKFIHMWEDTRTSQKFLVVAGPLLGKRITDDNEDYVLYNRSSRDWTKSKKTPKCVLVHRSVLT